MEPLDENAQGMEEGFVSHGEDIHNDTNIQVFHIELMPEDTVNLEKQRTTK